MCLRTICFFFIIFTHFVLIVALFFFFLVWGVLLCVRDAFSGYEFQITFTYLCPNVAYGMFYYLSFKKIDLSVTVSQAPYNVLHVCDS